MTKSRQEDVFETWEHISHVLHAHPELRTYYIGGLAVRMRAAVGQGAILSTALLRNHSDIDILVFEEDVLAFLRSIPRDTYKVWLSAKSGAIMGVAGEHHHVSLKHRATGVPIGVFIASASGEGRMVRTNRYDNYHPPQAFENASFALNGMDLRTLAPEWLYLNCIMRIGEKKNDSQLLAPYVDFARFHQLQLQEFKRSANAYEYHAMIAQLDDLFAANGIAMDE